MAASKQQPIERLAEAWEAGVRVFGENRVQEAAVKQRALPELRETVEWHLLGPLQSNKVRAAVERFDAFHSLDRLKIARTLEEELAAAGRRRPAFVEVNLGGEATKHGFPPDGLARTIRPLADLAWLEVVGLMAIPPWADDAEGSRRWFRRLRELRDELLARPEWSRCPGALSMGMSHDFEVAIEEGATHVRVGTALFGERS